ncbi:MAG: hypothetical protein ACRETR_11620, partial [Steroidobacteraceae bacterium]
MPSSEASLRSAERVSTDGHPGLARSRDCAAQCRIQRSSSKKDRLGSLELLRLPVEDHHIAIAQHRL